MDKYNAKRYDECLNNYLNIPEQNMTAYDYKIMGNCYIFLNDKKNALKVWGKASIMDPQDNNLKEVLQKYGQ